MRGHELAVFVRGGERDEARDGARWRGIRLEGKMKLFVKEARNLGDEATGCLKEEGEEESEEGWEGEGEY